VRTTRRTFQFGFLALTLAAVFVVKGNAERWCPFGGVEAAYTFAREGNLTCSLGVSNFYILGAVLLLAVLLRRVFCGYACPVGTLSEWLGRATARLGIKPAKVPYRLDRGLALLKYAVLGVILFYTYRAGELVFRGYDPCYALISRHGEDITFWAYVVAGGIVLGSLFVTMPFCRWFCPLAAVFNPFSRFGFTRVKRDEAACTNCGKCARVCPMAIPVDKLHDVTAARCMSCLECVEACPQREQPGSSRLPSNESVGSAVRTNSGSGPQSGPYEASPPAPSPALFWGPPRALGRSWPQAALVGIMLACIGAAVATAYAFPIASYVRTRGEAPATTASFEMKVKGLKCRGTANAFASFLERGDELAVHGYLKIETWPAPGAARTRITYDPAQTNELAIKKAATEPYFNADTSIWEASPFEIEGYDMFAIDDAPGPTTQQ
jgi:polyferredoxin